MSEIHWLASYPKSGNTWIRVLLANYVQSSPVPLDINALEIGTHAAARTLFDEWCGVESSRLEESLVRRLRPGIYRSMAEHTSEAIYLKVHDAWECTDVGEPLFPPEVTAGVVYVVRNPLDLVASYANHWGVGLETAASHLCNPAHVLYPSGSRLDEALPQRLGCWSRHVRSWVDESALRVQVVRYEDLLGNPHRVLGEIVRFCALPWSSERVARAVAHSSFAELSQQEAAHGFREQWPQSRGAFFRKGEAGAWRSELPVELAARIVSCHGETMARFGYVPEDWPNSRRRVHS